MPWPSYVRAHGMTWCVPCPALAALPWGVPRHAMAGLGGCLGIPWVAALVGLVEGCRGMHMDTENLG
jgi:hypothetical protein